jgi:hypothetical protein
MKRLREYIELRKQLIASPYVSDAVSRDRNNLLKFFTDSRKLETAKVVKKLDGIRYSKPWPKGTSNDDAFDLAIMEAITIVREEMR